MNILHINTNDLYGGAAKVMNRLLHAQNEGGHCAKAIVHIKETSSRYTFPFDRQKDRDLSKSVESLGMLDYDYFGVFDLINNPLFRNADIVHLHNIHGYYFNPYGLSILSHLKPIIWTLHDMQSMTGHCAYSFNCERWETGCGGCPDLTEYPSLKSDRTALNWLEKYDIYNKSKLYIVSVAKWIEKIASRVMLNKHPIETIYNGVNVNVFRPMDKDYVRKKYGIPTNKIIIGAVANGGAFTQERKGGKYVQEVIDKLIYEGHDVLLVNVGGDTKGFVNEVLYNVGYLTSEMEMAEVYNTFDIYLFPSLADTCPLVISEAMACGVPVVTFDTGGISELVQHGLTGFVAPSANAQYLYEYTLSLVINKELRLKFSSQSIEYCRSAFDFDIIMNQYYLSYKQAIQKFNEQKDNIFYFEKSKVPSVVWESEQFKRAEYNKNRDLPYISSNSESNIYIISENKSLTNNTISFEEAKNMQFLCTDIVYVERANCEVHNNFIDIMLYKEMNTEVLLSTICLTRKDNSKFYSLASSLYYKNHIEVNTSRGGIFYKGDFFSRHRDEILKGKTITCSSVEEYNTDMIKMKVDAFLNQIITKKVYIYGAGSHTKELFEQCSNLHQYVLGIIDSNTNLIGNKFLEKYPVLSLKEVNNHIPILVSSATYEREIHDHIALISVNPIITIYNN